MTAPSAWRLPSVLAKQSARARSPEGCQDKASTDGRDDSAHRPQSRRIPQQPAPRDVIASAEWLALCADLRRRVQALP